MSTLVHPRLLASLGVLFSASCTIQQATSTPDEYGAPVQTWVDLAGHVGIPCGISPTGGQEMRRADSTIAIANYSIYLRGAYPAVTERMRAVVGAVVYDILAVETDSRGVMKTLKVRTVN